MEKRNSFILQKQITSRIIDLLDVDEFQAERIKTNNDLVKEMKNYVKPIILIKIKY